MAEPQAKRNFLCHGKSDNPPEAFQSFCYRCHNLDLDYWPANLKSWLDDEGFPNNQGFETLDLHGFHSTAARYISFEAIRESKQKGCPTCSILYEGILIYNKLIGGAPECGDIVNILLYPESPFQVVIETGGSQWLTLEFYTTPGI